MVFVGLAQQSKTHMFEIVIAGVGEEFGESCGSKLNQFFVGINCEDGFDTLVGYGKGYIIAGLVSAFESLFNNSVAVFGGFEIAFS